MARSNPTVARLMKEYFRDFAYCPLLQAGHKGNVVEADAIFQPSVYDERCTMCVKADKSGVQLFPFAYTGPWDAQQPLASVRAVREQWVAYKISYLAYQTQADVRDGKRVADYEAQQAVHKAAAAGAGSDSALFSGAGADALAAQASAPIAPEVEMFVVPNQLPVFRERTAWAQYTSVLYDTVRSNVCTWWRTAGGTNPILETEERKQKMEGALELFNMYNQDAQERRQVVYPVAMHAVHQNMETTHVSRDVCRFWCTVHDREGHFLPVFGRDHYNTRCFMCPAIEVGAGLGEEEEEVEEKQSDERTPSPTASSKRSKRF